jgi:probable F420-dependent oxidoreductase
MRIGALLRNAGPASTPALLAACARAAEAAGLDDIWVNDHIAIPREESSGSGGRYLDPLATLAYWAGVTERIGLGTAVLILPYRPALPTAKWLATIQELSAGRLTLGAGVGWMAAEFRASGVDRRHRGAITDECLRLIHACFAEDEPEVNGQRFIFSPRPARPRVLIGGAPPHALARAARYGDGWLPAEGDPEKLRAPIADLARQMRAAGRGRPEIVTLTTLPVDDPGAAAVRLTALAAVGVTGVIHPARYADLAEFERLAQALARLRAL